MVHFTVTIWEANPNKHPDSLVLSLVTHVSQHVFVLISHAAVDVL